ncbi:MAG: 16S rRNA (guanine(527)-N(7))-methyltransferase RsmG [Bacteroidota bacterium]
MQIIEKYFTRLSPAQQQALSQLFPLYQEWNAKINLISRKDIDNLYEHHILHSLAIAQYINFAPQARVLDLGTGGGFPGIPLAILFPNTQFTLIDGTLKKIKVVKAVAEALGLSNVTAIQIRAEEVKDRFDFVVSRAVASMEKLIPWSFRLLSKTHQHALPNGLIALKGGNVKAEFDALPNRHYYEVTPINDFFQEPYFEEKFLVYVQG